MLGCCAVFIEANIEVARRNCYKDSPLTTRTPRASYAPACNAGEPSKSIFPRSQRGHGRSVSLEERDFAFHDRTVERDRNTTPPGCKPDASTISELANIDTDIRSVRKLVTTGLGKREKNSACAVCASHWAILSHSTGGGLQELARNKRKGTRITSVETK